MSEVHPLIQQTDRRLVWDYSVYTVYTVTTQLCFLSWLSWNSLHKNSTWVNTDWFGHKSECFGAFSLNLKSYFDLRMCNHKRWIKLYQDCREALGKVNQNVLRVVNFQCSLRVSDGFRLLETIFSLHIRTPSAFAKIPWSRRNAINHSERLAFPRGNCTTK